MGIDIKFRRGQKIKLPDSAPSGMPLWCEDTCELYMGTGDNVEKIGSQADFATQALQDASGNEISTTYDKWELRNWFTATESNGEITTNDNVLWKHGTALYNNDMNWTNNVLYVDNFLIQARYGLDDAYEVLNGTRVIADEAFDYVDIVSVDIPGSVQNIGYLAFGNCGDLEVFNVDEKNSCYSSEDGVLFNADKTMLIQYPRAKPATTYSVPESVNTIGDRAFYNCRNLESIIIGSGVTSIGADAFMDCYSLNEMLVKATTPPTIDPYSFHASGIETIYVPAESLDAYKAAEVWNRFNLLPISDSAIGKMEMPENIRISDGFLYNPEGLPICIYDMQGHKVYCGSNTTVSLHNGIYILRCGERSLKVKF